MSARASTILVAVQGLIDNASGLTGTGKVIIGHPPQGRPATIPSAYLWHDGLDSVTDGEPLGNFRRDLTLRCVVYAQAPGASPSARVIAALDLQDLVTAAIEADRSIGGNALDVMISGVSTTGDDFGMPNAVAAELEIRIYWSATSGEGL